MSIRRRSAPITAWLDHLPSRDDVDGTRVAVWGGSFGAYWAARLAFTAADRIKGAVFHGGNVHYGFQKEWLVPAFTTGGATYLFGAQSLLDARGRAVGAKTVEEFLDKVAPMSLKTMGLLDKPSAPLLGVNGKLDDQAPIADIYLLMEHGNPKSARVYAGRPPHGPHARPARPAHHRDDRRMAEGAAGQVGCVPQQRRPCARPVRPRLNETGPTKATNVNGRDLKRWKDALGPFADPLSSDVNFGPPT